MSVQEFYSAMTDLWDQLTFIESNELKACDAYINRRGEQRLVQFLIALRSDFEGVRGSVLHRSPLPSIDSVVSELFVDPRFSACVPTRWARLAFCFCWKTI